MSKKPRARRGDAWYDRGHIVPTLQIPMKRTEESIFEYACHEGNYALTGVLAGARADEKRNEKGER